MQATDAALAIRVLAPTRFNTKEEDLGEAHPLDQLFCCIEEDDAGFHDVKILVNTVPFVPDLMKGIPFMDKLFQSCYKTQPNDDWEVDDRFKNYFEFERVGIFLGR